MYIFHGLLMRSMWSTVVSSKGKFSSTTISLYYAFIMLFLKKSKQLLLVCVNMFVRLVHAEAETFVVNT
jgi:hypothetical protein